MKTLVNLARKGDASAFGALYESYAQGMYQFALWYLKNTDDAQDAVQNCALQAYRGLNSLRDPLSFRPWIFKILANACRDLLREKKRHDASPLEDVEISVFDSYEDGSVTRLLACLDDEARRIVTLSVLGDFNSREISRMTGINENTVRSKLSRSLQKLRGLIENGDRENKEDMKHG